MENLLNACGCCEGVSSVTPESVANRPGLATLKYRVGTHSSFLETMLANLSSHRFEGGSADGDRPLRALGARYPADPSIALLDAWATVADVLTFYQERIANEGFLRTAEERRSVLELARLVGYRPRPGVAASGWLALELDAGYQSRLEPRAVKARTVPGPDETAQTFENIEPIEARAEWNRLRPRLSQPQSLAAILRDGDPAPAQPRIYVKGVTTDLKRHDVVLVTGGETPRLFHVAEVVKDAASDRTLVSFQEMTVAEAAPGFQIDPGTIANVERIAEELTSNAALEQRGVAGADTAGRVASIVADLVGAVRSQYDSAQSAQAASNELLSQLAEERDNARDRRFANLAPWLADLVTAFAEAIGGIEQPPEQPSPDAFMAEADGAFDPLGRVIERVTKARSVAPRGAQSLDRDMSRLFAEDGDIGLGILGSYSADLEAALPAAVTARAAPRAAGLAAHVFRAAARPFGHNAPPRAILVRENERFSYTRFAEWTIDDPLGEIPPDAVVPQDPVINAGFAAADAGETPIPLHHDPRTLYLDAEYKLASTGWIVVERGDQATLFLDLADSASVVGVHQTSLAAYGLSGKSTRVDLAPDSEAWLGGSAGLPFTPVRQTMVHCESEALELAEEPLVDPIGPGSDEIELDGVYIGLESGRWLVVSGERDDIPDATGGVVRGIAASELVMLAGAEHRIKATMTTTIENPEEEQSETLTGDSAHTFIRLANPLSFSYRRDSVAIHANVVKATHGESRDEILGGGDASKAFQSFALRQTPVTYTAAPIPGGAASSLEVYVNDVRWPEADSLLALGGGARGFTTKTGDESKTSVVFGDGVAGARPPTGQANIRAIYRSGIGKAGNVAAGQISQLATRPLGLKGVVNPLPASGGADCEDRDTARQNAPRTVTALDRLVSVSDYADFARAFAGIGKALAATISDGRRQWVHVTIARADNIPIDATSDLFRDLRRALADHGEPNRAVAPQVCESLLLAISANVRVLPDHLWDKVADAIRAKLYDVFGFTRRNLGQDVTSSEVIAAIQSVAGVDWVDLNTLGGLPERTTGIVGRQMVRRLLTPREIAAAAASFLGQASQRAAPEHRIATALAGFDGGLMRPAQVAYLSPAAPDMLVINQIIDPLPGR